MKLQTIVEIAEPPFRLERGQRIAVVGSCFAQLLGGRLEQMALCGSPDELQREVPTLHELRRGVPPRKVLLKVHNNPTGVIYNPLSVARTIEIMRRGEQFTATDLTHHNGLWHHLDFHGKFSDTCPQLVLQKINRPPLEKLDTLVLTLGTAYVYQRQGRVVANCHKIPEREFTRRRISVEETLESLRKIAGLYPAARIIISLSPIRHLRDGLAENSLSKATLRVAIAEFCAQNPSQRSYFPAYEIMHDQLRDYRFTTEDMCHPTPQAQGYIWERFAEKYLTEELRQADQVAQKRLRAQQHRPLR